MVMRPRQPLHRAQINGAHLLALAVFRQEALARKNLPARPGELLCHRHSDHPVVHRTLTELPRQITPLILIHTNHRPVRPAFRKKPALGRKIAPHPGMPVQVVGTEIGKDRHIRRQTARQIGLVRRQLQHHHFTADRRIKIQHPPANVARQLARALRVFQDVMDECRGGGFPV